MVKKTLSIIIILLAFITNYVCMNYLNALIETRNVELVVINDPKEIEYSRPTTTTTTTTTTKITTTTTQKVSNGRYDEVIEFENGVSNNLKTKVINNYNYLPNNIKASLKENKWKILVVSTSLKVRKNYNFSILALTNYQEKTIYLDYRESSADALFHEIGHYLNFISGYPHIKEEFEIIYNEEKDIFKSYTNALEANVRSKVEYFAEAYEAYMKNKDLLKNNCPKTYAYLDHYTNIL